MYTTKPDLSETGVREQPPATAHPTPPPSATRPLLIDASTRVHFEALDSGTSRAEQAAVYLARGARGALPNVLLMSGDALVLFVCAYAASLGALADASLTARATLYLLTLECSVTLLLFVLTGLYTRSPTSAPEELRRITGAVVISTVIILLAKRFSGTLLPLHAGVFLGTAGAALVLLPLTRGLIRMLFAPRRWWGHRALVISREADTTRSIIHTLQKQPRIGIKPVAALFTHRRHEPLDVPRVTQLHGLNTALEHAKRNGIEYAIIAQSDLDKPEGFALLRRYENAFKHWLIVPRYTYNYSLWVRARDLDGVLGLELTNHLNRRLDQITKRTLDIALTVVGGLCILPLLLLIALAIRLDSKGGIFYTQKRIGQGGRKFNVLKFRSMRVDADANVDEEIDAYLQEHPEERANWLENRKLKHDPRVTRVGRLLRKGSLDELPQLWNVLKGEMSLVGPRPALECEQHFYGRVWNLYKRARPGITGQWQVSGRADTSFRERAMMDAYYIRNWSIWLDIYILARTIGVVLKRDGAY